MKLDEFKSDPTYRIAHFMKNLKNDAVEKVSELHAKLGVTRNKIAWYLQAHKIPTLRWNGAKYIGTKKAIRELKKIIG